ncbi:MAG: portal protein [Oleispira sp.]
MAKNSGNKSRSKSKDDDQTFLEWSQELKEWQESDADQRDNARESDSFLLEKDGQWEDNIAKQLDSQKRPRYTFDKVTPVIETMMADIEDMDFGCNVKPAGSGADKDLAKTYEGMIRTIQNMSRSDSLFRDSCRRLMRRGFDAWIVRAKYADAWSFEQDLFIEAIPNSINRVWTSNTSNEADGSDSEAAYVLSSMSPAAYKKKWPNGSGVSVDDFDMDSNGNNGDDYQPEVVTIAERYYRKESTVEIAQMSNGDVHEVDDDYKKIKDELEQNGITEVRTKKVQDFQWCYAVFDGGGILQGETETVFKSNPVVTVYGNYEHMGQSSKIMYSGIVLKEMDAQRVHNYAKSREIEEGALAPRSKWWMTKKQAVGHQDQLSRMNISADPIQFYNPDPEAGAVPFYSQTANINPALNTLGNQMAMDIKEQAGVFSAMQGDFQGQMSEDTVRMQIDRGTAATRKWVNALINGIRRTCDILVETIPVVYDTKREFAITGMDGTEDLVMLNEEIYDQQSGQLIKKNNLNAGKYKVVCDAGPAFANKLEAGLDAMLKYAAIDPSIVQQGGDIMLNAIDAPLVGEIAERKRMQMLQAGMIPPDQMTDEEKEAMQQQSQQPKQPDANMVFAEAEMKKAQVQEMELQIKQGKLQLDAQAQEIKMMELQQKAMEASNNGQISEAKAVADIRNKDANTIKTQVETQNLTTTDVGQQIDNLQKLAPTTQG